MPGRWNSHCDSRGVTLRWQDPVRYTDVPVGVVTAVTAITVQAEAEAPFGTNTSPAGAHVGEVVDDSDDFLLALADDSEPPENASTCILYCPQKHLPGQGRAGCTGPCRREGRQPIAHRGARLTRRPAALH